MRKEYPAGLFVKSWLDVPLSQCGREEGWVVVMKVEEHTVCRHYVMLNVNVSRNMVLR